MKLHIFGASGSGVTTLGQALAQTLHCTYLDSDDFYWEPSPQPFTQRRPSALRNQQLLAALAHEADWILGGSIINWELALPTEFDLAVLLWVPPAVRLARLEAREHERYGAALLEPPRQQQLREFLAWAAGYDDNTARGRTLQAHEQWLRHLACPTLEIRDDTSVADRIQQITSALSKLPPACRSLAH